MASTPSTKLTEEEYLTLDRAAEFRSELLDGEMVVRPGCSLRHARLQRNILCELSVALRGGNSEAFTSDFRVRVSSRMYTYPDISVVCGKPLLADERQDVLLNPAIIFEVLSPSTEKYDRGLKLQRYRTIESLREYILVNQHEVRIEEYTRQPDNMWILRDCIGLDSELRLDSIVVSLPLRSIYDSIDPPR